MTVRNVVRRGERRLVIDIPYRNSDGTYARYRRDAEVQTLIAARAEERRRLGLLATIGLPFEGAKTEMASERGGGGTVDATDTGKPGGGGASVTFREFVSQSYLPAYGATRLKPSTLRGYCVVIESFLDERIGHLHLSKIGAVVVRTLDAELVKRGLRPSSRRQMQCVIRSVLRYGHEAGALGSLPVLPPLPKTGATISRAPTREEVARIIERCVDDRRLALLLAALAGLRASEVRGLRWKDVDLDRALLVVRRGRCRGVEAPPKSGHERIVPLHPKLLDALRKADRRSAYVVADADGAPLSEHAVRNAFKSACRRAGIAGVRLHDLRHFFVTALFASGTAAPVVQRLAGHEHLATTQRYAHARLPDLADAVARLAW